MARTKASFTRAQAPRPADNVLALLNRIRVLEERETHFSRSLQAAMDEAQTMENSLRARISQLEDYTNSLLDTTDKLYAMEDELRKDKARLQNEVLRLRHLDDSDSESDTESEADSDSEYEPERPWLQDVYADIEQNGCRAQRFARILRTTVRFPNYDINEVYNEVLNTDVYPTDSPLQKEDIHPNFWTALGRNEEEKTANAKRVMELLYRRPY
jgi:chromosome segregation ATPase